MSTASPHSHTLHWARLYDLGTTLFDRRLRGLRERMIERSAISPGDRVLDVGCGPGRLTLAAARAAGPSGETLGIDASSEMIALASERAARESSPARFRVAAVEALPAPDDHFDVVLASLMLHHLPPPLQRRGLAEIFRVLKPDGRLVVLEFSATPSHGVTHLLCLLGLRRGSEHAEQLRGLEQQAGFTSVEVLPAEPRAFCLLVARKPAPTTH